MNLSASKFDAFKGNPLAKPVFAKQRQDIFNQSGFDKYNFDALWRGSVNNLLSSENITQDLITESIKELELAMQESKRMLAERDTEILRLREVIENNKKSEVVEENKDFSELFEKSQKRIVDLECEISEMKVKHSKEKTELKTRQNHIFPPLQRAQNNPECNCGSVCKSFQDLRETKQKFEEAKAKYENLKRKVREFRKQAEINERLNREEEKSSTCTIQ